MKKFTQIAASAMAALMAVSSLGVMSASAATVKSVKLKASVASNGVKLSWGKNSGAKKFVVSRKKAGAKTYSTIKTITNAKATTFTDKTAKAGVKYTYSLTAVNGNAAAKSTASAVFLKTPTGVKASAVQKNDEVFGNIAVNKISWKKAAGAKKYGIYRATVSGSKVGKYRLIDYTKKTTYIDQYIEPSAKGYKYKVATESGNSRSILSKASAKVINLGIVSAITEKNASYTGINVEWSPVPGVKKYSIYRSVNGGKYKLLKTSTAFKKVKNEGMISLIGLNKLFDEKVYRYTDKDVTIGKTYSYYVIAQYGSVKSFVPKSKTTLLPFLDYDFIIEKGEDDGLLTPMLNYFLGISNSLATGLNISITSDNPEVLEVTETDGKYSVKGVSVGDAFLTVKTKVSYGIQSETQTQKIKVRVTDEPVYYAKMKVGDIEDSADMELSEPMGEMFKSSLEKIAITSSDEKILKIVKTSKAVKLKAVSAGVATINMSIDLNSLSKEEKEQTPAELLELMKDFKISLKVLVEE